ncbi:9940_t:CDS:2, partial [Dentiscutata heterogama]
MDNELDYYDVNIWDVDSYEEIQNNEGYCAIIAIDNHFVMKVVSYAIIYRRLKYE